ncbi:MAG: peptidoglycan editing factor PgeF [Chloroflexota bacterium]|nr:peptidoglycan editing factor PgeF [Chloroflexota bacterium]
MERIERDGLVYYRLSAWADAKHGIFTRRGGVSDVPFGSLNLGGNVGDAPGNVRCNHERMYAALDVRGDRACTVWQVHSADVVIAASPVQGRRWLAAGDALMTDKADTPLSMRYADCTPILLRDARQGVIAMAHAGWRGTVQGMSAATVRAMMAAYGCRATDIEAWIGPSIGVERYQVGAEVVDAVRAYFGGTDGLIRNDPADGTAYFDLWAANRVDLERAGVERITIAGMCTASNTEDWFSHRGEQGRTGRFGAVLSL